MTSTAASFIGKAALQAGMHAITGGMMSALESGNFGSGFLSGAVSSIIAGGIQALGTNFTGSGALQDANRNYISTNTFGKGDLIKAVMIASGGLSGGASSAIAGGNFWKGFRQGIITSGLNHVAHFTATIFQEDPNAIFYFKDQKELDAYINKHIGNKAIIEKTLKTKILLATDKNLAKDGQGYFLGGLGKMSDNFGNPVGGYTNPPVNGISTIFIAPAVKSMGFGNSNMYIVHELVHAMGNMLGYLQTEAEASTYSMAYANAYGNRIMGRLYYDSVMLNGGFNNLKISWRKLPSFINTGLKR